MNRIVCSPNPAVPKFGHNVSEHFQRVHHGIHLIFKVQVTLLQQVVTGLESAVGLKETLAVIHVIRLGMARLSGA